MKRVLIGLLLSAFTVLSFVGGVAAAYTALAGTSFIEVASGVVLTLLYGLTAWLGASIAGESPY